MIITTTTTIIIIVIIRMRIIVIIIIVLIINIILMTIMVNTNMTFRRHLVAIIKWRLRPNSDVVLLPCRTKVQFGSTVS